MTTPHSFTQSVGDVPDDDVAPVTDQEAKHNYGTPDGAFQAIEDLAQLMQAHIHATSSNGKSLYREVRTHKPFSFDGTINLWAAESQINQIARIFTVLRCSSEEKVDLAGIC